MSFSVVLEGMTIAAFVVLLAGGKQKREQGWGFMATMAALAALVQAVAGSLVVLFFPITEVFPLLEKFQANLTIGVSERQ